MEGVSWKSEYKKVPLGFGIQKLIIGAVVEDAKVLIDDLQTKIEAFEDEVQSVDIPAINRI